MAPSNGDIGAVLSVTLGGAVASIGRSKYIAAAGIDAGRIFGCGTPPGPKTRPIYLRSLLSSSNGNIPPGTSASPWRSFDRRTGRHRDDRSRAGRLAPENRAAAY